MQRAAHAYLQTQVTTTSQGELLIMLYDGAINFLNQAKDFLAVNDMAKKGINISKALDILNELESTLNLEKGGTLAANLRNLYSFCTKHLVNANMKKDPKMIDDVIKILAGLRSAYAEIASLPEARAAAQTAADNIPAAAHTAARAQAGTSPSGGAAPAPGVNARIRNMHARYQQKIAEEQALESKTADEAASAQAQPAAVLPPQEEQEMPLQQGLTGSGFIRKNGADLYRKFAGQ